MRFRVSAVVLAAVVMTATAEGTTRVPDQTVGEIANAVVTARTQSPGG